LGELLGRRNYAAYNYHDQEVIQSRYAEIDLFPVSIKAYFYEEYFRDVEHLEANLKQGALGNWRVASDGSYRPERDRDALDLYVRYNSTPRGIRVLRQRKVFVFRRAPVTYYPVDKGILSIQA
jgi:hypothetical protein